MSRFGSDFFADSIFKDEPPQEQLDFMDFDLERVDNFTFTGSPVSPQDSPLINDNYLEGIQRLTELMQRSQETRLLLKLKYQHESSKILKRSKEKQQEHHPRAHDPCIITLDKLQLICSQK
jgi:hypothetical protein